MKTSQLVSPRYSGPVIMGVVALLLAGIVLIATAGPSSAEPEEAVPAQDVDAWLDGLVPTLLDREGIPGAVVSIVATDGVITERGFGMATTGTHGHDRRDVDPQQTRFRVGSISKLVVATAVMQLVEGDELDLDAPVSQYLDFTLPNDFDTPITMRHLLSHTAGFEDQYRNVIVDPDSTVQPLGQMLADHPPQVIFEPGTTPAYSNYGASVAAYIVQRVSGKDFADYAQQEVLDPATMPGATFEQSDQSGSQARAYPDVYQAPVPERVGLWPAGSLAATGADMSGFMRAHLNRSDSPLLGSDALATMHGPALGEDDLGTLAHGPRMGLGFFETRRENPRVLSHGGDVIHSHSALELYPDEGLGIFIAVNGSGTDEMSTVIMREQIMSEFADRYLRTDVTIEPTDTAAEHAQQAAGSYSASRRGDSTFTRAAALFGSIPIHADGQALRTPILTDAAGEPARFIEVEPWLWQEEDGRREITIRLDDAGQVEAVLVNPAHVLQPQSTAESLTLPILLGSAAVLLTAFVLWPVRAVIGWRLGAPIPLARFDRRLRRLSLLAVGVGILSAGLWLIVQSFILNGGSIPLVARVAQVTLALGVAGVVPAVWRAVRGWKHRHWWTASLATVIALAFLGLGYTVIYGGFLLPSLAY